MRRGLGRHNYRSSGASSPVQQAIAALKALNPVALFLPGDFVSSSGTISQWNDSSGSGHPLLQGTGVNQPTAPGDGSALFDGVAQFMVTAPFALNQPVSLYVRFKRISIVGAGQNWVVDGSGTATGGLFYLGGSSNIDAYAGSVLGPSATSFTLGTYFSTAAVLNGASSVLQVGLADTVSGAGGASNPGAIRVGQQSSGNFSNIQVAQIVYFNVAHDATTRATVIGYINTICAGIT